MNEEILTTKKPINQYPVNLFGGGALEIFIPSTPNYINFEFEQFSNFTFTLLVFRNEDSGKFFNTRTKKGFSNWLWLDGAIELRATVWILGKLFWKLPKVYHLISQDRCTLILDAPKIKKKMEYCDGSESETSRRETVKLELGMSLRIMIRNRNWRLDENLRPNSIWFGSYPVITQPYQPFRGILHRIELNGLSAGFIVKVISISFYWVDRAVKSRPASSVGRALDS